MLQLKDLLLFLLLSRKRRRTIFIGSILNFVLFRRIVNKLIFEFILVDFFLDLLFLFFNVVKYFLPQFAAHFNISSSILII